ncbi:MAG: HAD hydrolase-like protein [Methanoregula sp.]|nr:HAD hydrolase-like protein [Methanoregula sp.]
MLFYDEEKIGAIKACPHVAETLPALRDRGLKLGVVTDAHNGNALKRLRKAGLKRIF